MKKLFLFAAIIIAAGSVTVSNAANARTSLLSTTVSDHSTPPPAAVLNSFRNIFGNVPVRQWKARSNDQWRVHFINNGRAWEATFTSAGVLVKSEPA